MDFKPPNLSFIEGQGPSSNTMCHWTSQVYCVGLPAKWHANPSNDLSWMHECDRLQTTDDRPRYGENGGYSRNRL